jgi:5-methyltetrahydrofolate--homocysteine methyltransferase
MSKAVSSPILDAARGRVILFDGGLGSELIRNGLPQGVAPEAWNIDRPDVVTGIHREYFRAGADVVTTNSFGGSPIKLAGYGLEGRADALNGAAARLAASVRPEGRFVAGSIGPTGKFLKPQGEYEPGDFEKAFAVQAGALNREGVDFLIIETMYDLQEALCAVRAARASAPERPVFATLTFNRSPRGFFTLMGDAVVKCARALEEAGAAAVGANCTLDSAAMADLVGEFRAATSLPANAGQPILTADNRVTYSQGVEEYVSHLPRIVANGARFVGGCCGTNPDYIRRMAEILKS